MRPDWLAVPNLVTLARLGLAPVFVWLHLNGRSGWALGLFIFAMSTDWVDGLLARLLDQRTKLGALLDPIADKLLLLAALVMLTADQTLPWWLLAIILVRDGFMIFGALMVNRKHLEIPAAPSRVGKYATFALTVMVVLALIGRSVESKQLEAYTAVMGFIAGLCIVVSTTQYFARFGYLFFVPRKE